jgi:hypothetical protein
MDTSQSFKDTERVKTGQRYKYSSEGHLDIAMIHHQAKQKFFLDHPIFDFIKKNMEWNHITPERLTQNDIFTFLSKTKSRNYSSHYKDINLIYSVIKKISPPDITRYEEDIRRLHREYQAAREIFRDSESGNMENVYLLLYIFLSILGADISIHDFYSLKNIENIAKQISRIDEVLQTIGIEVPKDII